MLNFSLRKIPSAARYEAMAKAINSELKSKPKNLTFSIKVPSKWTTKYYRYEDSMAYEVFDEIYRRIKGRSFYNWSYKSSYKALLTWFGHYNLPRWKEDKKMKKGEMVFHLERKYCKEFKRKVNIGDIKFDAKFDKPHLVERVKPFIYADKKNIHDPNTNIRIFGRLWVSTGDSSYHVPKVEFDVKNRKIINVTAGKKHREIKVDNLEEVFEAIAESIQNVK